MYFYSDCLTAFREVGSGQTKGTKGTKWHECNMPSQVFQRFVTYKALSLSFSVTLEVSARHPSAVLEQAVGNWPFNTSGGWTLPRQIQANRVAWVRGCGWQ